MFKKTDVRVEADDRALVNIALEIFGRLDVGVNNAAPRKSRGRIEAFDEENLHLCVRYKRQRNVFRDESPNRCYASTLYMNISSFFGTLIIWKPLPYEGSLPDYGNLRKL